MPRLPRQAPGGIVYHVLNRGVGRMTLFDKPADYAAFEKTVADTLESCPMRIPGYSIMPNHWPLILHPEHDGDLASFMQKLTITHVAAGSSIATRWVAGMSMKSFPVQSLPRAPD